MADDQEKTYIGIKACGCVTMAMVAGIESKQAERKYLRGVIEGGRRIEVTTAGEARKRLTFDCEHVPYIEDVDAEVDRLLDADVS